MGILLKWEKITVRKSLKKIFHKYYTDLSERLLTQNFVFSFWATCFLHYNTSNYPV